ncbi:PilZ domain-containing protein [Acinetobacter apis]|uniref:Type IV pilus assembly protein PilZ n=1 Tax=Acinetobacter apis TaxID=1229165 RepID=A0A217EDW1_9GAMM|nr:PilZ domain-containing protein [Acinetobacter apis]SNQ28584.1 type IV pilus assembly protein PilZ [Acinetobacter apis]
MQNQMGNILQVSITDRATLQASYLPFVIGGGLFVPSTMDAKLGQEVFVLATLPEQKQKIPLTGKVVWISQKQSGAKPQGFAIQLNNEKGTQYRLEVERILAGSFNSKSRASYTI